MCNAIAHVCFVPTADVPRRRATETERPPRGGLSEIRSGCDVRFTSSNPRSQKRRAAITAARLDDANDYVVLNDGRVIGRIFQQPQATATASVVLNNHCYGLCAIHSRGYSETEQAMADFKAQWTEANA